jgi:carboxymethylenebutenolidase
MDRIPGIVLVQEVFGVDAHIRAMTEKLAGEGYAVLAPDLYSREGVPGPKPTPGIADPVWSMEEVRAAVASLPDRRVLGDLEGALDRLAAEPGVDRAKLGAIGFCMGGNYAYLLGCSSRRVRGVVDFYGRFIYRELSPNKPIQPLELALNLSCPMLAMFGERDPSITTEDVEKLRKVMDQFAREVTVVTFPDAGHGFMNDRRRSYDRETAERAWTMAVDFLRGALD